VNLLLGGYDKYVERKRWLCPAAAHLRLLAPSYWARQERTMAMDDNVRALTDKMIDLIHRHGRKTQITPADVIMAIAIALSEVMALREWSATELKIACEMVSQVIMGRVNADDSERPPPPAPEKMEEIANEILLYTKARKMH
jgi:hypothetical protein